MRAVHRRAVAGMDVPALCRERTCGGPPAEPIAIPDICGNGHLLTPDNLKVDPACIRAECGQIRALRLTTVTAHSDR